MPIFTKGTLPPEEGTFMPAAQAHYKALQQGDIIVKTEIQQIITRVEKNIEYAVHQGRMETYISFLRDALVLENDDTMTRCIESVKDYFINLGYEIETFIKYDSIRMKIKW